MISMNALLSPGEVVLTPSSLPLPSTHSTDVPVPTPSTAAPVVPPSDEPSPLSSSFPPPSQAPRPRSLLDDGYGPSSTILPLL
jgi:hypothetical protein